MSTHNVQVVNNKIVDKKPIIPTVKDDQNTDRRNVVCGIDIDKEVEGKKPEKLAKEHNLLINDKNPEVFSSKVQLTKFIDKASLPIAGIASMILIYCIVAELSLALIISAALVMLVALIAKPIASYIQKGLLENSAVSRNLDNPNAVQSQSLCTIS